MRISATLPTGVTALLFEAARRRRALETRLVRELEGAGYGEVVLPILDYFEPYEPLLASSVQSELYRFVDRDGALLLLRADFTPMLARLLAPKLASLELPLRLFYRGDVIRYQEERPGRMREFYQIGAELIGLDRARADREVLDLFLSLLVATGAPEIQLVLGFAGALDGLLAMFSPEERAEITTAVWRRERRAVHDLSPVLSEIVALGVPRDPDALGPAAPELRRVQALAAELAARYPAVRFVVDLAEFAPHSLAESPRTERDRGYYDGLVFRAYAGAGALPVAAGGRYDSLFDRLGCRVPAAGFSLGLDRLAGEGTRP